MEIWSLIFTIIDNSFKKARQFYIFFTIHFIWEMRLFIAKERCLQWCIWAECFANNIVQSQSTFYFNWFDKSYTFLKRDKGWNKYETEQFYVKMNWLIQLKYELNAKFSSDFQIFCNFWQLSLDVFLLQKALIFWG